MLPLNSSHDKTIQYYPLPPNAYAAAHDSFVSIGFSRDAILDEYSFSTQEAQSVKINAFAFAHPKHRTPSEYAGFTVYNATNGLSDEEIVKVLAQSAAFFHLIHRRDRFSFWASTVDHNQVRPIPVVPDIGYAQLSRVLADYAVDLSPQRIVDVRQGRSRFTTPIFASEIQPLQLSLWATNVTRPLLVKHFGSAVGELRRYLDDDDTVVDIATQLLGATILADTGVLGDDYRKDAQRLGLDNLIRTAHYRFPDYFKEDLLVKHFDVTRHAYDILRQIRYVGFAPEMLTEIYTAAYGIQKRKEFGRYDTPLYLTRRIWETIPVEFLPPDRRVTVDMTCGWGSFLLAGYDRLSHLSDMKDLSLRNYLHGNDKEPLAARLASLGLLISTLSDSWHVDSQDALEWAWLKDNRPNIIVGNPPFGGARKGEQKRKSPDKKERYEEANKFLEYAIERLAPNGYLAMLMPQSFVAAEASPDARKILLEICEILELWDLPIGIFPEATTGTVVIFAQKKENVYKSYSPVIVRTVQRQTLDKFEQFGMFTVSEIVNDQSNWDEHSRKTKTSKITHIIDYHMILPEFNWQKIHSRCVNLQERAIVFSGAIVGKNPERKRWENFEFPKEVPWLTNAKSVIKRPFFIDYEQRSTIIYPNELEEPRKSKRDPKKDKEHFFTNNKVLLTAIHNPSWGRRVKIAIERRGYYVSDSFWVIVPQSIPTMEHITLEVIAAIVNWKISNAWIIEFLKHAKIPARAIRTIPFPKILTKQDCEDLTNAIHQLEIAAANDNPEPQEANQTIDNILKAAYKLDDETFERLKLIYEWDDNPQVTLDEQPNPDARWEISGVVESINAVEGTITLWLNGLDHFETVPITPVMPGWLLRPDVAFRTTIPRSINKHRLENVSWGKFYPQEYTYLSEEELFDQLTQTFYPETETR